MKIYKNLLAVVPIICILSFSPKDRSVNSINKINAPYLVQVANQVTGSQTITRVTYTTAGGTGVVLNMTLTSGQTYPISDYSDGQEITVRTTGVFDYIAITDQLNNEVERQYEDGSHIYVFTPTLSGFGQYTITMW